MLEWLIHWNMAVHGGLCPQKDWQKSLSWVKEESEIPWLIIFLFVYLADFKFSPGGIFLQRQSRRWRSSFGSIGGRRAAGFANFRRALRQAVRANNGSRFLILPASISKAMSRKATTLFLSFNGSVSAAQITMFIFFRRWPADRHTDTRDL